MNQLAIMTLVRICNRTSSVKDKKKRKKMTKTFIYLFNVYLSATENA